MFASQEAFWLFITHYLSGSLVVWLMRPLYMDDEWDILDTAERFLLVFLLLCSWGGVVLLYIINRASWFIEEYLD
jgi:hypothetical protein